MTTKINITRYERYIKFNKAFDLLQELDDSQYSNRANFHTADEALEFLKAHTKDNQFERAATTSAIIKAIAYLEEFEKHLQKLYIEGHAENERRAKLAKDAHSKAKRTFTENIEPLVEKLVTELENLGNIEGYSYLWQKQDLKNIVDRVMTAARVEHKQSVFLT